MTSAGPLSAHAPSATVAPAAASVSAVRRTTPKLARSKRIIVWRSRLEVGTESDGEDVRRQVVHAGVELLRGLRRRGALDDAAASTARAHVQVARVERVLRP